MNRKIPLVVAFVLAVLLPFTAATAWGDDYVLEFPTLEIPAGQDLVLPVNAQWGAPVQGYTTVFSFPPNPPIVGFEVSIENTLTGEMDPEFTDIGVSLPTGEVTIAILFDVTPPLDLSLPPVPFPLAIAEIVGTIDEGAREQVLTFEFTDGLGNPPLNNIFVVNNESIPPKIMIPGELVITPPINTVTYQFRRGDFDLDGDLSLLDAIGMLYWTFVPGVSPPLCEDAADADDDGHAGLNDGLWLLQYLFTGGPPCPPPFTFLGVDYTPDDLGCDWSPWPL